MWRLASEPLKAQSRSGHAKRRPEKTRRVSSVALFLEPTTVTQISKTNLGGASTWNACAALARLEYGIELLSRRLRAARVGSKSRFPMTTKNGRRSFGKMIKNWFGALQVNHRSFGFQTTYCRPGLFASSYSKENFFTLNRLKSTARANDPPGWQTEVGLKGVWHGSQWRPRMVSTCFGSGNHTREECGAY